MNKIDFQNGFALGMASGGVVEIDNAKEEQTKTVDITKNGTTEVLPDEGKTLSKVTVNVNVATSGGETAQSHHSSTSYEVWGETLDIAYNSEFEINMGVCAKDISNIKSGVYKMLINDVGHDALVMVTEEGIMININDGNMYAIMPATPALFGTTMAEGTYDIKLISINDIEDCVVYSENKKTDPTTCIYVTNGFIMGNAQVSISANGETIFDNEVTFEGFDGYIHHYSYTIFPYLGEYIEQGKTIVIKVIQTNNDGVIVTKTINGSPQLIDGYYVWGNSDLFVLPS